MRLRRTLDEFIIDGVEITLPLFRAPALNAETQDNRHDIHWLEQFLKDESPGAQGKGRPASPGEFRRRASSA
ncbi:MAG: hypothetical protein ABR878_13205 [Roseiarcus sp.]|jgi:hypothetical protein